MTKVPKKISAVLFYNKEGEILLQDRRGISKWGEDYGFFGGKVEEGETFEQCARREMREELEIENVPLINYKTYKHKNPETGIEVERSVYLSGMPNNVGTLVCHEGLAEVRRFDNSLNLKFIPGFGSLLEEIYLHLKSESKVIC